MSAKGENSRYVCEMCQDIMHYIDTHIYEMNALSELSELYGYNYCHLSYVFKKKTGNTIMSYYRNCRLTEAKKLLDQKISVAKVAEKLKYSSMYSFSKAFKKHWGISPRSYIKKNT